MPWTRPRNTIFSYARLNGIGTRSRRRSKPQIIIRRYVERACSRAGQLETVIFVVRITVIADNGTPCHTGHRTSEAIIKTLFQSTSIERVKVGVECSIALIPISVKYCKLVISSHLIRLKMSVCGREELLAEEITHMSNDDKQDITGPISHRDKHRWVNTPEVRAQ